VRAILVAILCLTTTACGESTVETGVPPDQSTQRTSGGTMSAISRDTASAMATKGMKDLRKDPARFDVTISETDTEWQVRFAGKQPRPPGDEVTFYIDKRTGAMRHMLGE
jgi:hypothetical protein